MLEVIFDCPRILELGGVMMATNDRSFIAMRLCSVSVDELVPSQLPGLVSNSESMSARGIDIPAAQDTSVAPLTYVS